MAAPQARISAIGSNVSDIGFQSPQSGAITYTKHALVGATTPMGYSFGVGLIVFLVLFAVTWILLISFTPCFILVDDPHVKGSKMLSYGTAVMWSVVIGLVLTGLVMVIASRM